MGLVKTETKTETQKEKESTVQHKAERHDDQLKKFYTDDRNPRGR
jgi:hypothetical protein